MSNVKRRQRKILNCNFFSLYLQPFFSATDAIGNIQYTLGFSMFPSRLHFSFFLGTLLQCS